MRVDSKWSAQGSQHGMQDFDSTKSVVRLPTVHRRCRMQRLLAQQWRVTSAACSSVNFAVTRYMPDCREVNSVKCVGLPVPFVAENQSAAAPG